MSLSSEPSQVWTISALTQQIRQTLQSAFGPVWAEGEISNFSRSGAGHCYLTLKDEASQLRAVLWRDQASLVPFQLHDGLQVLAHGLLDVYGGRGQYQMRIRQLLPKGLGPLELAFRQMRAKLEAEGLFSPDLKRPIPRVPKRIAVVTSPSGAAVRDFLEVALRRWQACDIIIVPVPVQGDNAAPTIARALSRIAPLGVDLVALIRGGGSLEDLWAFNEEIVARAIRDCCVPVVTGVGHEIDVTIADLVSDLRALTPTEAAERIFPDASQIRVAAAQWEDRLGRAAVRYLGDRKQWIEQVQHRRPFREPLAKLEDFARRVDDLERQLCRAALRKSNDYGKELATLTQALDALSPLQVLTRGYAVAIGKDGRVIRSVHSLQPQDSVRLLLTDGRANCTVHSIEADTSRGTSPNSFVPSAPSEGDGQGAEASTV